MLALTVTYYQNNDVTIRLTSHDSHGWNAPYPVIPDQIGLHLANRSEEALFRGQVWNMLKSVLVSMISSVCLTFYWELRCKLTSPKSYRILNETKWTRTGWIVKRRLVNIGTVQSSIGKCILYIVMYSQ